MKPVDGGLVLESTRRRGDGGVLELMVLLSQLLGHASPHVEDLGRVERAGVLRHVGEIGIGDPLLNRAHRWQTSALHVRQNRLGKTSHQQIRTVELKRPLMKAEKSVGSVRLLNEVRKLLLARSPEKLLEIERMQGERVNLPDRIGVLAATQRHAKQAARSDDVALESAFVEVLERRERTRARLHLVKEHEGRRRVEVHTACRLDLRQEGFRRDIAVEQRAKVFLRRKIDVHDALERMLGKGKDRMRLPHLARTMDNEGLSGRRSLPREQFGIDPTLQLHSALPPLNRNFVTIVTFFPEISLTWKQNFTFSDGRSLLTLSNPA